MKNKATLLRVVSLLLLLSLSLAFTACGGGTPAETTTPTTESPSLPPLWETATYREDTTVGDGSTSVTVKVTAEGKTITITLKTEEATLADALLAAGLCEGTQDKYGLMISHVNGIRADYDLDGGYWWNILVNGKSASSGASGITLKAGDTYELIRKK